MRPLRLVREGTKFDFLGKRKLALVLSTFINVAAVVLMVVVGLNFGIDFRGGVVVEVKTNGPADLAAMRTTVGALHLGDVSLQEFGAPDVVLVRVQRQESSEACFRGAIINLNKVRDGGYELRKAAVAPDRVDLDIKGPVNVDLKTLAGGLQIDEKSVKTGADNIVLGLSRSQSDEWCQQVAIKTVENGLGKGYQIRRTESVGPKVGGELVQTGIIAVLVTLFGIVIYVWIRFEWQFALGALIALTHDVLTTLGVFAVTQIDFNLASLAAVLTVAGYSINDTVVVFDRVRENLRKYKKMPLVELLNLSINEMLARTIMTSGTTFLAVLALALFGGPVILGFSVAMLWGVIVGTYSSIWMACAILVYTGMRADRLRGVERQKPVNQPTAPVIRPE